MSSASRSRLQNYVPAILFTTYDGYYIYSPTKTSQVAINKDDGVAITSSEGDVVYVDKDATGELTYQVENNVVTKLSGESSSDINKENNYTTNSSDAKPETNYMLKPFIYYSAEYKSSDFDVIASYSLDNYLTVYGTKSKQRDSGDYVTDEFTKSGYLIDTSKIELSGSILVKLLAKADNNSNDPNSISATDIEGYEEIATLNRSGAENEQNKNNVRYFAINVNDDEAYNYINYYEYGNNIVYNKYEKIYSPNQVRRKDTSVGDNSLRAPIRTQTGDEIISDTLEINSFLNQREEEKEYLLYNTNDYNTISVKYNEIEITDPDAMEYYIKAYFFTKWVQNNLGDIQAKDCVQDYLKFNDMSDNTKRSYTDFTDDNTEIFNFTGENQDPEREESLYQQHKRAAIKNSIQYNLNSAISTFNDTFYNLSASYRLPVMSETDWNNILNNVCMVAFMQGLPTGTETFNSYAVVKSTNNNIAVSLDNMYFVDGTKFNDGKTSYHTYDCPELKSSGAYYADQSAEFKYDARRILTKVDGEDTKFVYCLYEDSTNTYYEIETIDREDKHKKGPQEIANMSSFTSIQIVGEIPNDQIKNYEYTAADGIKKTINLTTLPNGSEPIYLYDHKNLDCYTCSISKNYVPVVKYYEGDLRRTYTTKDGELLIEKTGGKRDFIYYSTGKTYAGTVDEKDMPISVEELKRRKTAVYTYLAHIRNNLYKTNDYINR